MAWTRSPLNSLRFVARKRHISTKPAPVTAKQSTVDDLGVPLEPTWSVQELLSSYPNPKLDDATFQKLHRLSALTLPPESEAQKRKEELEELMRLVDAVRIAPVDADGMVYDRLPVVFQLDEQQKAEEEEPSGLALLKDSKNASDNMYKLPNLEEEQLNSGLGTHSDSEINSESGAEDENDPLEELTEEALAAYKAKQERTGVIYISRIPPGMSPAKVRHLMSGYGTVGRVYLQQEDPKRAYLRQKHTSTKKPQYTEGWVEFESKKVARSVAEMLNAQPVGGKKGTRWRDDVWTMKYLPRFKWYMLTEQIAHEQATHAAKLRVELSQSKKEQQHYLKQVEIGRQLERKRKRKGVEEQTERRKPDESKERKRQKVASSDGNIDTVLGSIF